MNGLVAVDGSEESDKALEYAVRVIDGVGGSLTIVHSADPNVYDLGGTEPVSGLSDANERLIVENVSDAEDRGLDILDEAAERADELGLDAETQLLYGDPASAIPNYAAEEDFGTIFIGHQGRSERMGDMLGSVAKDVVERATIPVTVVR